MHVTSCSKTKTIFYSTLMYIQSPAVATQHPRTAGEQASTAPAKGAGLCLTQIFRADSIVTHMTI